MAIVVAAAEAYDSDQMRDWKVIPADGGSPQGQYGGTVNQQGVSSEGRWSEAQGRRKVTGAAIRKQFRKVRTRYAMQGLLPLLLIVPAGSTFAQPVGGAVTRKVSARARHTAAAAKVHTYNTTFAGWENPISEKGNWANGSSAGSRLWGNVQTNPGFAYGVDEPTKFGDPSAILTGAWGPEQTVTATVKINRTPTGSCCHEVELRLRTTIASKAITGYEAYCSVMPDNQYCHIARWNGPNGSYWNFETGTSTTYVANGDVLKATVSGSNPTVITLYKNGMRILQAFDTGAAGGGFGRFGPWTSGNPGMGFYDDHNSHWNDFGFSSFSATDGRAH